MSTDNISLETAMQVLVDFYSQNAVTEAEAANFEGSAARVVKMAQELSYDPRVIANDIAQILKVSFPTDSSDEPGMVVQGPISLNSCCPHHLLPVRYAAYLAYLPKAGGKVLGLSKLSRIPALLARRFVLQEQLVKDIADAFYEPKNMDLFQLEGVPTDFDFDSEGCIVTLVGTHTCMSCRGVLQDARTLLTERRGAFRGADLEGRFYQAVQLLNTARPFGA